MFLGNNLIGINIFTINDGKCSCMFCKCFHNQLLTSTKCPAMAAAAAIWGLTKWVLPPLPWRPSKLRFEVEAQRSPDLSLSGFMAKHMLQPEFLHSAPAAVKILCSPSASACFFTVSLPGTTRATTFGDTFFPLKI